MNDVSSIALFSALANVWSENHCNGEWVPAELHTGHIGIVKMKFLARLHVWWPEFIKKLAKDCDSCLRHTASTVMWCNTLDDTVGLA